ncbi:MAG TPA: SusC/RagA family TonB-linked outer membrane protein, partial [Puia sp.]|nr:SusC/RagA family TonB-linked outer membrane protein [Puia sp.]
MKKNWFYSLFTLTLTVVALLLTFLASAQDRKVTGKVTNGATGEPLGAVSILVKGTDKGAYTDGNGNFTLDLKPGKKPVLIFSYSGFEDQTVTIDSDLPLNIKLKSNDKNLDEIVVIGYGTVKKRDLTGSVVSIKGDEVRKIPASNLMESVQGKIAGVDIVRTKGLAGSGVSVAIRGNRSITAGNGPLYIIDGIQFDNYPFQDINSNDVESLEVLKDASSTAIYGSRGANGVIIITTKKGSNGKIRVSANSYYGVSEVAGYPKPMTGPQFANLKRQAARTIGKWNSTADDPAVFTSATELAAVKSNVSTYYPGLLISKGSQQDYGVGVSGGNDKTRVYFSFDYFKEKGVLKNDFSGRYTLRLNIDQTIASTFKVGLESQLTYYDINSRTEGVLTIANKILPYYTPYNTDGTLARYPGNGAQFNPLFDDQAGAFINKTNTTRILSTAWAEWK